MPQYQYYLEDFTPDASLELGSKTVTEEEIIRFAREFDPQPFHIDPVAAAHSPFGGIIASGWQTCGIAMRMLVDTVLSKSASIGSPGIEQLRWTLPVRPGDTLSARVVVLANRPSQTKPDRGTIKFRMEVTNQHGEQVMWHESFGMFLRRPA
ncbi:MAG: MaoC family dehydratase [Anaerolineales bacterium]|nr:MaoC family dehydratase [Anaerolineales bacterium]